MHVQMSGGRRSKARTTVCLHRRFASTPRRRRRGMCGWPRRRFCPHSPAQPPPVRNERLASASITDALDDPGPSRAMSFRTRPTAPTAPTSSSMDAGFIDLTVLEAEPVKSMRRGFSHPLIAVLHAPRNARDIERASEREAEHAASRTGGQGAPRSRRRPH